MEIALYIHLPFCAKRCDYCDFFSTAPFSSVRDSYVSALINQAFYYKKKYNISAWKTIYIGGGTPSLLSSSQITFLVNSLVSMNDKNFFTKEITMEVNPESLTEEKIITLQNSFVTRLSVGIQSLNQKALDCVSRLCTSEQALQGLELIKTYWQKDFSTDSIAGLPFQSEAEFILSMEKIREYKPSHFSLYTLTLEEETPLYRKVCKGLKFDSDEADRQWLTGKKFLNENGYEQYEVSNFSKKGKECLHNLSYWQQEPYLGLGSGAVGTLYFASGNEDDENAPGIIPADTCENFSGVRWTNTKNISLYENFWNKYTRKCIEENAASIQEIDEKLSSVIEKEILSDSDLELEYLMMGFRSLKGVCAETYEKRFASLEWKGNISRRLGEEKGVWKDFSKNNLAYKYNDNGKTFYALNEEGLLFLNKFLLDL